MPFFSIIIPSYNRAHIIDRAIQGVLDQTFQDFEIIIVDDGSVDNTEDIIKNFSGDLKIKYIFQNNAGVCLARNRGAQESKGKYLVFLDSDDMVETSWLQDFYDLAIQNKDLMFCSLKIVKHDLSYYLVSALNPFKKIDLMGNSAAGSWAIKKDVFLRVGMFDDNIKFGENVELRFRLNQEQLNIGVVDKYNFTYFESLNGGSRNLKNKIESNLYIINKHIHLFNSRPRMFRFYLQNIAVAYAKLREWNNARLYFWKAYKVDVLKIKTLFRLIITLFPFMAKKIWK